VAELGQLIRDLAAYEREPEAATATDDQLHDLLFGGATHPARVPGTYCFVIEHHRADRHLAGMALWNLRVSTWRGAYGIYLEDLYVRPELRGLGYGRRLLERLVEECRSRGYPRLEWSVLDWNTPAIDFYRALGALPLEEWTTWRLEP